jgi:hypothetical protein
VRKIHKDPNEARYVFTRFRVLTSDTIHHQSSDHEQCQESSLQYHTVLYTNIEREIASRHLISQLVHRKSTARKR